MRSSLAKLAPELEPANAGVARLHMPWTRVHELKLAEVAGHRDLANGLVNRESVSSFPKGHLIVWDISGFTKIMESLPDEGKVAFVQDIIATAVRMATDLGLVMLAPPAGDQGMYFVPESGSGSSVAQIAEYLRDALRIVNPLQPDEFCKVKAVILPVGENAVQANTFLDRARGQDVVHGFQAVTGPAYEQSLQVLKTAEKNSVTLLGDRTPGLTDPFPNIDMGALSQGDSMTPELSQLVDAVAVPQIPEGPHYYGVFRAKGNVGIVDPLDSVRLASALFEAVAGNPAVRIQRQDEQTVHLTVEDIPDADRVLAEITSKLSASLAGMGLQLQADWRLVKNSVTAHHSRLVETAGGTPVQIIKQMKRPKPPRRA